MPAVWYRFRVELRRRWRAWLGLGFLLGLAGGVVLAAAAGARRTDTAYARSLEAAAANDFSIESFGESPESDYDALERLPAVEASGRYTALALVEETGDGGLARPDFLPAASDGRRFYTVDRPKLLDGRLPEPDRAGEALANRTLAERDGLEVGDTVDLLTTTFEEIAPYVDAPDPEASISEAYRSGDVEVTKVTFTITGVGLFPDEVAQDEQAREARLAITPAFVRTAQPVELWTLVGLRLKDGADRDAIRADIERVSEGDLHIAAQADRTRQVDRSVSPYARALTLFAVLAAVASMLVVGQALTRQAVLDAGDDRSLRALGISGRQGIVLPVLRAGLVAAVAAMTAVTLAVVASPLTPMGPVRAAEPDPGVAFDALVLVPGALVVASLALAWGGGAGWLHGRRSRRGVAARSVGSALVRAAERAGAPPTVLTGVRMAVQPGRGATAVPVRTTIAGAAIAVAALVAVFAFGAGVDRLVSTPRLYGWDWDVMLTGDGGYSYLGRDDQTGKEVADRLDRDPGVSAWALLWYGSVSVDGRGVPAVGIGRRRGSVQATLLEGRAATTNDEVVLGSGVLRRIGKGVGDTVDVGVGERTSAKRVVGRAVFPSLGFVDAGHTSLGDGAALTVPALRRLNPEGFPNAAVVRLHDGATGEAALARLRAEFDDPPRLGVLAAQQPGEISAYDRLGWTPLLLGGVLAVLAVGTLAHALVTATRRRGRDLAVLATFGFTRGQLSAAVAWQATTVGAIALVLAVPAGLVMGRVTWRLFAERLGVSTRPVVPLVAVLILVPATLLVANLVAALPARAAARTRPAVVLRAE